MSKQKIVEIISALAEYYDKTLSRTQILMYVEDLSGFDPALLEHAVKQYRRNPKNVFFPLPASLLALLQPAVNPEQQAIEAVARIVEAVSRFGWNNGPQAKEFVGELGWYVVQRDGGWQKVCEHLSDDNLGMTRAQWREIAKSALARGAAGELDQAPALPGRVQDLISQSVKKLEAPDGESF